MPNSASANRLTTGAMMRAVAPVALRRYAGVRTWREGTSLFVSDLAAIGEHLEAASALLAYASVTRVAVLLVGWLAVVSFGIDRTNELFAVSLNDLVNLPARWDAGWYAAIAANGYSWSGNPEDQQSVAFFPAFPAMLSLIPRGQVYRLWFGTFLAIAFFGVAIAYFVGLARRDVGDERAAAAAALLAAYPFAIYFSVPYTESLFLAGCVGAFYHLRRDERGRACAWALLTGLSRPNGCLLAIPLALAVWETRHFVRVSRREHVADAALIAAPVVGMLLFSLYLFVQFGDGLAWMRVQSAWGRDYSRAASDLVATMSYVNIRGLTGFVADAPFVAMNGAAGLAALAFAIPIARRFGLAYAAFVVVNVTPAFLSGGTMSLGRMTSILFPVFLWLAHAIPRQRWYAWVAAFAVGQGLVAALFFTWRPIF
jgi:hypothetical protein